MLPLLFAACSVLPYHRPPDTTLPPPPPLPAASAAVDVSGLLSRLDSLLAVADTVDSRDRLVELRELILGAASGDPGLRAAVMRYGDRVLSIEERSRVQVIEQPGLDRPVAPAPVVEEEVVP